MNNCKPTFALSCTRWFASPGSDHWFALSALLLTDLSFTAPPITPEHTGVDKSKSTDDNKELCAKVRLCVANRLHKGVHKGGPAI